MYYLYGYFTIKVSNSPNLIPAFFQNSAFCSSDSVIPAHTSRAQDSVCTLRHDLGIGPTYVDAMWKGTMHDIFTTHSIIDPQIEKNGEGGGV